MFLVPSFVLSDDDVSGKTKLIFLGPLGQTAWVVSRGLHTCILAGRRLNPTDTRYESHLTSRPGRFTEAIPAVPVSGSRARARYVLEQSFLGSFESDGLAGDRTRRGKEVSSGILSYYS